MKRTYFVFELKSFFANKKNLAAIILLFLGTLYYSLIVNPKEVPNESVDETSIQNELTKGEFFEEHVGEITEGTHSSTLFALSYFIPLTELNWERVQALDSNDLKTYTEKTIDWYLYQDAYASVSDYVRYSSHYYGKDQHYPKEEGSFFYRYTASRYQGYLDRHLPITRELLDERTGLQTLQRVMQTVFPLLILALVVIFSNDILVKDRKHLTLVKSYPLSFTTRLWIKTGVVLAALFLTVGLSIGMGLLLVSAKNGIGSFNIPVPFYDGKIYDGAEFHLFSMGSYLLKSLTLYVFAAFLLIRFLMLLSVLVGNEFFNLIAGLAVVFAEGIYYKRGIGFFTNLDRLPTTFFKIGDVLIGYQNHLYNSYEITFRNGVLAIGLSILAVEVLLFLLTRFQRFKSY